MTPIPTQSAKHGKLKELVRSRRDFALRYLSPKREPWRSAEKQYRSFVEPDEKDAEGKKKNPYAQSIVVPMTYALMQTQLAFDLSAFTQRRPMIQLDGTGPEDVRAAKLMEQVLHYESAVQRQLVELYGWLLDRRRYGTGFLWTTWGEEVGFRTVTRDRSVSVFGFTIPLPSVKERERFVKFQGNQSYVVDPFTLWWDPRVSVARLQQGEFIGRTLTRSFSYMRQQQAAGFYVNVDAIPKHAKRVPGRTAFGVDDLGSDRDRIAGLTTALTDEFTIRGDTVDFMDHGYVELDEMVATIIPRDYELSGSGEPEKWWITLANDQVIVRGEPFDPDHQDYPVAAFEQSVDPHGLINPGMPEILQGLQEITSWLYNSHVANIRKALNDMFLVNPGLIEMSDLLRPQAGRLIRIKRDMYGVPQAIDNAVKQLQVVDVTRTHLTDVQGNISMMERLAAVTPSLQGLTDPKDRTLGEQQMAAGSAGHRLRSEIQLAWVQGVIPWTAMRIQNLQQYMTEERYLKVVGEWPRTLRLDPRQAEEFLKVNPDMIRGQFTFQVIDGSIRASDQVARTMQELWTVAVQDPILRQVYDTEFWFQQMAIMLGFTNVDEFIRQQGETGPQPYQNVTIGPDEQIAREVEKGNLVPNAADPMQAMAGMREQAQMAGASL